jgi:hypothetical protein
VLAKQWQMTTLRRTSSHSCDRASDHGLMPTTTARSLAVAARNIFSILSDRERADLHQLDLEAVIKRFNNKTSESV